MTPDTGGHHAAEYDEISQSSESARVVVVGVDAGRLAQYQAALGLAEVPYLTTLDIGEAERLIQELPLEVLVLDLGLQRLALLQLYGLARSLEGGADVQVLFVGQDGKTGPDDHFLPGEPSPVTVASWASDLLAGVPEPPALDLGLDDRPIDEAASVGPSATGPVDEDTQPGTAVVPDGGDPVRAAPPANTAGLVASTDTAPDMSSGAEAGATPGAAITQPEALSRRSYTALVRIGLVLLILGALLLLVRMQWSPPAIAPPPAATPTVVPEAAPTRSGRASPPMVAARAVFTADPRS